METVDCREGGPRRGGSGGGAPADHRPRERTSLRRETRRPRGGGGSAGVGARAAGGGEAARAVTKRVPGRGGHPQKEGCQPPPPTPHPPLGHFCTAPNSNFPPPPMSLARAIILTSEGGGGGAAARGGHVSSFQVGGPATCPGVPFQGLPRVYNHSPLRIDTCHLKPSTIHFYTFSINCTNKTILHVHPLTMWSQEMQGIGCL